MEKKKSDRKIYNAKFKAWITSSSSHGIPNIFRNKNPIIRVMWILVFLGSLGYCVSAITKSIIDFMQHKTTLSSEIIQEIPAPFPAVTFCNLSPYNEYYSSNYIIILTNAMYKQQCLDYLRIHTNCNRTMSNNSTICIENEVNLNEQCMESVDFTFYKLRRFIAEKLTDDIFIKEELGFDLYRDMMFECKINKKNCQESDFTRFWSHRFGNCYVFNGDANNTKLYKTNQKGSENGLQLRFILKRYDENPKSEFASRNGIYLVVHNQSALPFTLNNGIFLSPSFEINLAVERVFIKNLYPPYSDCIDGLESDNPYSQRLFGFFRDINVTYYDQDVCLNLCYQDKLIDTCGCMDIITQKIRNASYCLPPVLEKCMNGAYSEELSKIYQDYCIDACPEECSKILYNLDEDYASSPTLSTLLFYKKNFSHPLPDDIVKLKQYGRDAFLSVNIYYENLHYTLIEENALISYETLLGSVGGQLGLFIGVSFLSFVEIIEFAIEFLTLYYKKTKAEKKAGKKGDKIESRKEGKRAKDNPVFIITN